MVRLLVVWTRGYRPPNTTIVKARITQRYRHGNCTSQHTWTAVNDTAAERPGRRAVRLAAAGNAATTGSGQASRSSTAGFRQPPGATTGRGRLTAPGREERGG